MQLTLNNNEIEALIKSIKASLEMVNTANLVSRGRIDCSYFKVVFHSDNLTLLDNEGLEIGTIPYYRILKWCSNCNKMELSEQALAREFFSLDSQHIKKWMDEKPKPPLTDDVIKELLGLLGNDVLSKSPKLSVGDFDVVVLKF